MSQKRMNKTSAKWRTSIASSLSGLFNAGSSYRRCVIPKGHTGSLSGSPKTNPVGMTQGRLKNVQTIEKNDAAFFGLPDCSLDHIAVVSSLKGFKSRIGNLSTSVLSRWDKMQDHVR